MLVIQLKRFVRDQDEYIIQLRYSEHQERSGYTGMGTKHSHKQVLGSGFIALY